MTNDKEIMALERNIFHHYSIL